MYVPGYAFCVHDLCTFCSCGIMHLLRPIMPAIVAPISSNAEYHMPSAIRYRNAKSVKNVLRERIVCRHELTADCVVGVYCVW